MKTKSKAVVKQARKRYSPEFKQQRLQQSEHARLKREVTRLEEENAFLKKAAAYFAKLPK